MDIPDKQFNGFSAMKTVALMGLPGAGKVLLQMGLASIVSPVPFSQDKTWNIGSGGSASRTEFLLHPFFSKEQHKHLHIRIWLLKTCKEINFNGIGCQFANLIMFIYAS